VRGKHSNVLLLIYQEHGRRFKMGKWDSDINCGQ